MLINQLRLAIAAQQNAEIIKPCNHALQLDPVDQENCDRYFGLAYVVQERILKVLSIRRHSLFSRLFLSLATRGLLKADYEAPLLKFPPQKISALAARVSYATDQVLKEQ